ncbi:MAG: thiamine phosphate synthase [Flavobacteriales bacterium]|nr:thiamine phosphate synthase [Flavobacteriales bacterium]
MKLIVISRSKVHLGEEKVVSELFEQGLQVFHLRKPTASAEEIEHFLKRLPQKYLNRVVLHTQHELAPKYGLKGIHLTSKHRKKKLKAWFLVQYLKIKHPTLTISTSFHSVDTLTSGGAFYHYAFLSPVFDSISKKKHLGRFAEVDLRNLDQDIIALGGINEENIGALKKKGYSGAAVLGAIWSSKDPIETFIKIKKQCEQQPMASA